MFVRQGWLQLEPPILLLPTCARPWDTRRSSPRGLHYQQIRSFPEGFYLLSSPLVMNFPSWRVARVPVLLVRALGLSSARRGGKNIPALPPQAALLPSSVLSHSEGKVLETSRSALQREVKHSSEKPGVCCCSVFREGNLNQANSVLNLLTFAYYCYVFSWKGQLGIALRVKK